MGGLAGLVLILADQGGLLAIMGDLADPGRPVGDLAGLDDLGDQGGLLAIMGDLADPGRPVGDLAGLVLILGDVGDVGDLD